MQATKSGSPNRAPNICNKNTFDSCAADRSSNLWGPDRVPTVQATKSGAPNRALQTEARIYGNPNGCPKSKLLNLDPQTEPQTFAKQTHLFCAADRSLNLRGSERLPKVQGTKSGAPNRAPNICKKADLICALQTKAKIYGDPTGCQLQATKSEAPHRAPNNCKTHKHQQKQTNT